jgi:hypothetical protein
VNIGDICRVGDVPEPGISHDILTEHIGIMYVVLKMLNFKQNG